MKINWKVRFKNKVWLLAFITASVAFVYQILSLFEVVPPVSEDMVIRLVTLVINILAAIGVVVDPTTQGLNDSDRAMTYIEPGGESKE